MVTRLGGFGACTALYGLRLGLGDGKSAPNGWFSRINPAATKPSPADGYNRSMCWHRTWWTANRWAPITIIVRCWRPTR